MSSCDSLVQVSQRLLTPITVGIDLALGEQHSLSVPRYVTHLRAFAEERQFILSDRQNVLNSDFNLRWCELRHSKKR